MKSLVAYFSASGTTARLAKLLAEITGSDLFEIQPEPPYSSADLNWKNPLARCNREKLGRKEVPVAGTVAGMAEYDLILLGFPIWYDSAPNVVMTFLKGYDLSKKKIALFATSGGSGISRSVKNVSACLGGVKFVDAKMIHSAQEAASWAKKVLDEAAK